MSLSIAVSYCVNKRLPWTWLTDAPMPHSRVVFFDCVVKAKSTGFCNDCIIFIPTFESKSARVCLGATIFEKIRWYTNPHPPLPMMDSAMWSNGHVAGLLVHSVSVCKQK